MKKDITILAIETSCDETACAIIRNGNEILSNIVATQIDIHRQFGGVVPEVASRQHVEVIIQVVDETLTKAQVTMQDIDAIAVTYGPGLIGALLIGVNAAKALAYAHNKPLIPVHHIAGHIYANQLIAPLQFPLMALIVSGGHTELVYMKSHLSFEVIGETRDDAIGEAYDKVARQLNLAYPGGPKVDQLAQQGQDTLNLPRVWLEADSFDFSFSGIKSAVINTLHNAKQKGQIIAPEDVAASFQEAVLEVVVTKALKACQNYQVKHLIVAGGVAANRGLREKLNQQLPQDLTLHIPPLELCTDNAAMIGAVAYQAYLANYRADLSLNAVSSLDIETYSIGE